MNCTNVIKAGAPTTPCDSCRGTIHVGCTDLSEKDIIVTRAKSRCLKVVCNSCSNNMSQFNELKSLIISMKNDFSEALTQLQLDFNEKLSTFKKEVDAQLNARGDSLDMDGVIEEIDDRQSRRCNIVIFGMPEQQGDLDGDTRKAADNVGTSLLLKSITPNAETSEISMFRLGRYNKTAPNSRPIKVTFRDVSDVHAVIRDARKLRSNEKYKNISISFDKTPRQVESYKVLKRELVERSVNGEKNLKIKYVRGIPKIMSLN